METKYNELWSGLMQAGFPENTVLDDFDTMVEVHIGQDATVCLRYWTVDGSWSVVTFRPDGDVLFETDCRDQTEAFQVYASVRQYRDHIKQQLTEI